MATMPNAPEPDPTASDTDLSHRGAATETQGSEPDVEVDAPRNVGAPAPKIEPSQEEPAAEHGGSMGPNRVRVTAQQVELQNVAPKICEFQPTTVVRHA